MEQKSPDKVCYQFICPRYPKCARVYIYDALNENICLYINNEYGNICQNYLI